MQRFGLFLWILSLAFIIPNDLMSSGGSKPAPPPPLAIHASTSDVFYVNRKYSFSASGGYGGNVFSTNIGYINSSSGAYTAPSYSGSASITVRDSKGNTATYRVPVYYNIGITPTSGSLPTGGNITFRGTGGVGSYKYSTNRGSINASNGVYTASGGTGTATITVKDARGNQKSVNITVYRSLGITPTSKNIMVGKSASFNSVGGMGPIAFSTNKGNISNSGGFSANAGTGSGTVTAADSRGARATASLNIYPNLMISPPSVVLPINGHAIFSASGGMGPYTYSSGGKGTIGANGVYTAPSSPGSAVITVTDSQGNKATSSATINSLLALSPSSLNLPINQSSTFTASGGVPGYTFSSSYGGINSSGIYTAPATGGLSTITVKDSTNIVRTSSVCVFAPLQISPTSKVLAVNNSFSFSASEGCKPYKFDTDIGSINEISGDFTAPATAGSGKITVTDNAGNTSIANVTVNPSLALTPPPLTLPINGKHQITFTGGVGPFKYTYSHGSIDENGLFTAPGAENTVTITVEDSTGVKRTGTICVYEPLEISPLDIVFIEGRTQEFKATHGCQPYEFSTGDLGVINSESGFFTAGSILGDGKVTVKDLAGNTASANITVNPPLDLAPATAILEINKKINFTASGGIPDYTFSRDKGSIGPNGGYTAPATKGVATITLTDSAGFNTSSTVDVYAPLKISPAIKILAVGDTFTFQGEDGFSPYKYSTSDGIIDPNSGFFTAPSDSGQAIITVEDDKGFKATAQVTINPALSITPTTANLKVGDSLEFIAAGGVGDYTFIASGGGGINEQGMFLAPSSKGEVIITVTDEGGHSETATVNVYEPIQISPSDKILAVNDTFTFTASEGVPPYNFTTNIGGVDTNSEKGIFTAPPGAGSGKVTVTDSIGNTVEATVTINEALSIVPILSDLEINKTLQFTAAGGVGDYTYEASAGTISPSGVFTAPADEGPVTITVRDEPGHSAQATVNVYSSLAINPKEKVIVVGDSFLFSAIGGVGPYKFSKSIGSVGEDSGLFNAGDSAGIGTVIVTDSLDNTASANVTVNSELSLTGTGAHLAINGNMTFTATGGVPGYTFSAIGGSIDENGVFTASGTGSQAVITVTDSVGTNREVEICVFAPLELSPAEDKTLSFGNSLAISANHGCAPYEFKSNIGSIDPLLNQYTAPASAGNDMLSVTDSAGNIVSINITINPSISISPTSAITAVNRPLKFNAVDGVPAYSYTAEKGDAILPTGDYTAPGTAGSDVVTVTDSLGNKATANITVNPDLEISPLTLDLVVGGNSKFSATGGVGDYTFSVPAGSGTIDNSGNFSAPANAGEVVVTVKDGDGYEKTATVRVFVPLKISPEDKVLALGDTFTFSASDGIGPYKYTSVGVGSIVEGTGLYSAGSTSGTGNVTVTDSTGNTAVATIQVNTSLAINAPFGLPKGENLDFKTIVTGGVPGYTYAVAEESGTIDVDGNYQATDKNRKASITVTDSSGVSATAEICVFDPLEILPADHVTVLGETKVYEVNEGCEPYTFALEGVGEFDSTSLTYSALGITGSATLTVTDAASNTSSAKIKVNTALYVEPIPEYLLAGGNLNIKVTGGVPDYTFTASLGSINQDGVYTGALEAGSATIKVTDSSGVFKTVEVEIYLPLKISDSAKTLGVNNSFGFSASGGVLPYVFSTDSGGIDSVSGLYTAPGSSGSAIVTVTDKLDNKDQAAITINSALVINPVVASVPVNRSLSFSSTGGVGPYTYTADKGQINLTTGSYIAPSEVGSAIITSTDSLGNKAISNVTIGPDLAISPLNLDLITNGNTNFSVSGGVGPYTFSVPAGSGTIDSNGLYAAPGFAGSMVKTVVVTVKDAENFEKSANLRIFAPISITPTSKTIVVGNTSTFSAGGGIGPYKFSKSIGSINEDTGLFSAGAITGNGTVTVTDAIGNAISANVIVNPEFTVEPKPAHLAINSIFNFSTSTSGGVPSYTYNASVGSFNNGIYTAPGTGGTAAITITDSAGTSRSFNICIFAPLEISPTEDKVLAVNNTFTFGASEGCSPYRFESTFGNIASSSGAYEAPANSGSGIITVRDEANNSATTNIIINPALTLVASSPNLEFGENINFIASGGVGDYTFSASSGTVDSNGVYSADGSLGTIIVTVTDSLNNTAQAEVIVFAPLGIVPSETQDVEVGEEIQFTGSGGVLPYTFSLSPSHGTLSEGGLYTAPGTKGPTTLTLTDSIGNSLSVGINVYASLVLTPSTNQLVQVDGTINFTASEGVPPYSWSVSPNVGITMLEGEFYAGTEGNYTVSVTDSSGKMKSVDVTVFLPLIIDPVAITLAVPDTTAFTASGGFPPYVFSSDIGSIDENLGLFNTLSTPGTGKVTVIDLNNNTATADVTILAPFEIVPEVASVEVDEDFTFNISGGVEPYSFTVDGGDAKGTLSLSGKNLTYTAPGVPGNYVISGVDNLNSSTVANVTVFDGVGISPPSKTMALNTTTTFIATGGTSPYTFTCDKGTINPTTGEYTFSEWVLMATITVTDANDKTAQAFVNGDFPNAWIWATGYSEFNKGGLLPGRNSSPPYFPGARGHSSNWSDNNGNIYLQGGIGYGREGDSNTSIMYYLWKYDTKTNQFDALETGSANGSYPSGTLPVTSSSAGPSGRYGASTFTDPTGKFLWLFGGYGNMRSGSWSSKKGQLNDLWKYEIATTSWTWISGKNDINQLGVYGSKGVASNGHPGGRSRSAQWRDLSGNLWVFGGKGFTASSTGGYLNDMWKFDVATSKWIYIDGSTSVGSDGKYTLNNQDTPGEQVPAAREAAVSWVDSNGIFWMFGGSNSSTGFLNDLWKYDSTKPSDRWTLVRGNNVTNKFGIYGTKGEADSANYPGARDRAAGFTDKRGNIWLFGGYGYGTIADDPGFMNDLWRLNTLSGANEWVYEGGDKTTANESTEVLGDHGELGVGSDSNLPGARSSSVFWQDSTGKFWFFGGSRTRGVEGTGGNYLNDLWKFFPE